MMLGLVACAAPGVREIQQHSHLPRQHELTSTPFYPQTLYQCGPAALATTLTAIGIEKHPDQLTPEVYVPERQGSLQIEMLATARRHGAVAVQIEPTLNALLQEIAAGNSVLVLQNLGLSWIPTWHYAVVVGYDLDRERVWLRSGTEKRQQMSLNTFERTWARSRHWGFVTVKPGQIPASAQAENMTRALLAFEKSAPAEKSKVAYAAAATRWPDNLVLLTGLGNTAYQTGDLKTAEKAFAQAVDQHPESAAAHNNLASAWLAQGKTREARRMAEKGLALAKDDVRLQAQIRETLNEIEQAQRGKQRLR